MLILRGFEIYHSLLDRARQQIVLDAVRGVVAQAPLFQPDTPYGRPMSVRMSSAGDFGWFSDRSEYRYAPHHPDGQAWPAIPEAVLDIWREVADCARLPESCLINYYKDGAKMGLHQDRDEADFQWPVVSVSLGDDALFRIGNQMRGGKTESVWLRSGDVVVMGGDARLTYHGVDRVNEGTSTLLKKGGRINLTLRVVR